MCVHRDATGVFIDRNGRAGFCKDEGGKAIGRVYDYDYLWFLILPLFLKMLMEQGGERKHATASQIQWTMCLASV